VGRAEFRPLAGGTWNFGAGKARYFRSRRRDRRSVRQSGGTVYVNFGRRWTRDFTLTVPRRLQAAFREAGRDPQMLEGRRVRVRGWLERRTGPIIEASAPEQIELLE
jgi:hypothetical protein